MLLPGIIASATPVAVGFLAVIEMLAGVLTGVTASGVVLAIFMSKHWRSLEQCKKNDRSRSRRRKRFRCS